MYISEPLCMCVQVPKGNNFLNETGGGGGGGGGGQTKPSISNHAHNPNLAIVQVSHMKVHNNRRFTSFKCTSN